MSVEIDLLDLLALLRKEREAALRILREQEKRLARDSRGSGTMVVKLGKGGRLWDDECAM